MDESFISEYIKQPKIITPNDGGHYFFGYYDMRASQGNRHLAHRVSFMDRMQEADDVAELGYLEDGKFTPFATTTAWNFQQGAMLQYHPFLQDTVYYNVCKDGNFCTVTHNYATGEKKYTDRATACVSPDGKWGLAVNFGRIFAFRPGYGYAGCVDPYAEVNAPAQDGIFLTDMETGKSRMLVNYTKLAEVGGFTADQKILVNHITFNPASNRYVALVRNFTNDAFPWWSTSMLMGDLDGNIRAVFKNTYASHYIWEDEIHLVAHCSTEPGHFNEEGKWKDPKKKSMFRINMEDSTFQEYDMPFFHEGHNGDIHCNIAPGGKYIIGDGYPIEGYRHIVGYNIETGNSVTLLKSRTVKPVNNDIRCDLHNQFVFDGKFISYDTTENGCRQIAILPIEILNF